MGAEGLQLLYPSQLHPLAAWVAGWLQLLPVLPVAVAREQGMAGQSHHSQRVAGPQPQTVPRCPRCPQNRLQLHSEKALD